MDDKKIQQKEILMKDVAGRPNYEDLVSELFRQSREKGDLDNLPGKGKPLQMDDDSEVPEESRVANRIMKNNHILPKWIELNKQIEAGIEALPRIKDRDVFEEKKKEINKKIAQYNLVCPPLLQKKRVHREFNE